MRLNHNTMAYAANSNLGNINNKLTMSMARLSSGNKINKSSDDPAGMAISQRMSVQLRGIERAKNNSNDGISLIQTAEGALNEVHNILKRMRELSVQAANETYEECDRDAIAAEIKQLREEIDRISDTTDFNGCKLLNGELNKRGYADKDTLSIAEIGGDITPGDYKITVTGVGTQAKKTITVPTTDITDAEAGNITINGFSFAIDAGMTADEVKEKIRDASAKIGIDFDMTSGELTTNEFGSDQRIEISASNDDLKALLGIDDTVEYGTDATADFGSPRTGFRDTAIISTNGNRITVTDKEGFKMVYDATAADDYNVKVLSAGPMVFQIGNNEGQVLNINISKVTSEALEIDKFNIYTHEFANEAIDAIDKAIVKISDIRSSLGAYQNRLDYTVTNLDTANENLTSALSRMKDTDMAEEITEYTQQNVLSQSALEMLTRSNARPEGLLQLFQR